MTRNLEDFETDIIHSNHDQIQCTVSKAYRGRFQRTGESRQKMGCGSRLLSLTLHLPEIYRSEARQSF